jgi:hypothetical protein
LITGAIVAAFLSSVAFLSSAAFLSLENEEDNYIENNRKEIDKRRNKEYMVLLLLE